MLKEQNCNYQDVAAIVTAMTDGEQPFLKDTIEAVMSDPEIAQVVLCVEEKNAWVNETLSSLATDSRLELVRMPMSPPGAVRNQALSYVRMTWVAYCDGDDVWCRGKTSIQRKYLEMSLGDFVGVDHYLTNDNGRVCAFALALYLPMTSSWMVRTEVMKQYPFNESMNLAEDGEWWSRTRSSIKKVRCPKMLLKYRIRSNSLSSNAPSKRRKAKIVALASKPLLRQIVLFVTWCIWSITRQEKYIWLKAWG